MRIQARAIGIPKKIAKGVPLSKLLVQHAHIFDEMCSRLEITEASEVTFRLEKNHSEKGYVVVSCVWRT